MATKSTAKSHRTEDGLTVVEEGDETPTYMQHPDIEGVGGPVARWSFDTLWQHKGWVQCDPPQEEVAPAMQSDEDSTVAPDDGAKVDATESDTANSG